MFGEDPREPIAALPFNQMINVGVFDAAHGTVATAASRSGSGYPSTGAKSYRPPLDIPDLHGLCAGSHPSHSMARRMGTPADLSAGKPGRS
jgi:hypothetical protein